MNVLRAAFVGAALAAGLAGAGPAMAQSKGGDSCTLLRDSLLSVPAKQQQQQQQQQQQRQFQQQPLSNDLLFSGGADTLGCLVDMLNEVGLAVTSPDIAGVARDQLVRVTGAVRSILTTQGTDAIRRFRRFDDLATASVLAFAARSDDPGLRINATLVLADVVDDTTVCVPIDHLYDPAMIKSAGGPSGRINLIGVVSVVAPWAYRENFENISRLVAKLKRDMADEADVAQAKDVLTNLENRLAFQSKGQKQSNMTRDLPDRLRGCAAYDPVWANAGGQRNLVY